MARKIGMNRARNSTASNRWEDYLDPGEKLLWQGAPATGLRFTGVGLMLSVFGLFFFAFAVFWVFMAASMGAGFFFALFGVPFVLIGLWLLAGHWFFDAYKRKRARYALTNHRALIARTVFGRRMESYPIDAASPLELESGKLDTVNFAQRVYRGKNGINVVKIGFRYISDGQEVFDLLRGVSEGRS